MRKSLFAAAAVAGILSATGAADAKTLGIVALLANDALNIDVIAGATEGAKAAGWDVKVIDTQASADKANAAMNTFAVEKVDAMFVLAFAATSVGSGFTLPGSGNVTVSSCAFLSYAAPPPPPPPPPHAGSPTIVAPKLSAIALRRIDIR